MSTTSESQPACAITSAEKLLGMPHQLLNTGFPAAHNSRTLFARAIRSSWCYEKSPPIPPAKPAAVKPRGRSSVEHFLVDDVVADRLAVEHGENVLHRGDTHAVDCLARHPCDMRCGDKVRQGEERIVRRCRLLVEDVECGTRDAVRLQRVVECLLVDDAAARGVDDE